MHLREAGLRVFCIFSTTVEYSFEDKCLLNDPLSDKTAVMSQLFDTAEQDHKQTWFLDNAEKGHIYSSTWCFDNTE